MIKQLLIGPGEAQTEWTVYGFRVDCAGAVSTVHTAPKAQLLARFATATPNVDGTPIYLTSLRVHLGELKNEGARQARKPWDRMAFANPIGATDVLIVTVATAENELDELGQVGGWIPGISPT